MSLSLKRYEALPFSTLHIGYTWLSFDWFVKVFIIFHFSLSLALLRLPHSDNHHLCSALLIISTVSFCNSDRRLVLRTLRRRRQFLRCFLCFNWLGMSELIQGLLCQVIVFFVAILLMHTADIFCHVIDVPVFVCVPLLDAVPKMDCTRLMRKLSLWTRSTLARAMEINFCLPACTTCNMSALAEAS